MVRKAAETMRNIYTAFGPGTANEHTVQWWFRKFCKENKRLEDEEHSGWLSEINSRLRAITEADPPTTTQEVAEELNVDHSKVTQHWKQIRKVKKLDKYVPHELTEIKKNHHFEVSSYLILRKNEPFLD